MDTNERAIGGAPGLDLARRLVVSLLLLLLVPAPVARSAPAVAEPFRNYYDRYAGPRTLGPPITGLLSLGAVPVQYFEKGRLEDHRATISDPVWQIMGGRLTAELMEHDPSRSVNGTDIAYRSLVRNHAPEHRRAPPVGFSGGVARVPDGIFVPFDPTLRPAPGYLVLDEFWRYITRTDLFPGGWLHDAGLPMTNPFAVETVKHSERRLITVQAFERTVLTRDPQNPVDWRVERGNLGTDALRALQGGPAIQSPAADGPTTLPLHILARVGEPGEPITATLRWAVAPVHSATLTTLAGEDGRGLVIGTPGWFPDLPPPGAGQSERGARLQLRRADGQLLAEQDFSLLAPGDPGVTTIQLYWVVIAETEQIQPQVRHIVQTPRIGAAALEELLWGPPQPTQIGYRTALPTPEQVLSFPGRQPDWGPRVRLRSLTIEGGLASADFSQELRAYGGGSLRVSLIRGQITRTLMQFPSVRAVRIAIEGQTEGVLEP